MNERSPVGMGRSLTAPSPPTHSGQMTRATATQLLASCCLDGDVEIRRASAQVGDASDVSVQPEIIGQSLGDGEPVGEEYRSQLDLNLSTTERPNVSVAGADITPKPDLKWSTGLGANTMISLTSAVLNELSELFGERFLVTLDRKLQVALVETVGEVEGARISPESHPIPDAHAFQIPELRTARSMFLKAREAHGSRERGAKPVETDQRHAVDFARLVQPGSQHNTERQVGVKFCACGCGESVPLATRTRNGYVAFDKHGE